MTAIKSNEEILKLLGMTCEWNPRLEGALREGNVLNDGEYSMLRVLADPGVSVTRAIGAWYTDPDTGAKYQLPSQSPDIHHPFLGLPIGAESGNIHILVMRALHVPRGSFDVLVTNGYLQPVNPKDDKYSIGKHKISQKGIDLIAEWDKYLKEFSRGSSR